MSVFRSLTVRLVGTYLIIIVLPFSLLGWFLLNALDQFYITRLQDDMSIEAGLLAQIVAPDVLAGQVIETQDLLTKMPTPFGSQARVFVFDNTGLLIGSSDAAFADTIGNPLAEPGLETASTGQNARGVEISAATGLPIAYVVQPISINGQTIGAIHLSYSLQQINAAQTELRWVIIGTIGITAIIASVFGWQLTRSIREPLRRLQAATTIIARGNLAHRVPEKMLIEFAGLARHFNQMTEALQQAEKERQRSFANIAHDVRTPLGSIRAAVEALDAGALEQPELRTRLITGLYEQINYLRHLTDELLRLAAYEGSGLTLKRSAINIQGLLQQIVWNVQPQALEQQVSLSCCVAPDLPTVWADADRVLEILFNLVDNALRYTPSGGRIELRAERHRTLPQIMVHVCDDGAGISAESLPRIFDRHWRGSYQRSGPNPNLGLGLSIVQEIVKAHGGTIGAENLPNHGVDFFFTLPVAA